MSIEDNKALVLRACKALDDRNMADLLDCVHEDGSWSIPYRPDQFQFAGFRDKTAFGEMVEGFLSGFTEFSFEAVNITAEDDRVSIEARSKGTGPGTARYKNVYNIFFRIRDGKIHEAREYFDPFEVLDYVAQWPVA